MKFALLLCCLLYSNNGLVLTVDNQNYTLQDFYALYPKSQWLRSDSTNKEVLFNNFIKRSLCVMEAKNLHFENDPAIRVKINTLSNQLLVNETYEQLVATPLLDPLIINNAKLNAKNELLLHHILVGYSNSYLAQPPKRSLDEALFLSQKIKNEYLQGTSFKALAEKYSDDPSSETNSGSLGWVEWGLTAPEFQERAFSLNVGEVSDPVLTAFGYHLIYVERKKKSDYYFMSNDQYESSIINLSKRSVRDLLRPAAIKYDSLKIIDNNILFNSGAIAKISNAYNRAAESGAASSINIYDLLHSLSNVGVVLVYGGKGFGPLWFANKIKDVPTSRHPVLNTNNNVISIFNNFVLQDIALRDGNKRGVNNSFPFLQRKKEIVSSILYDAYLKHLIEDVSVPDTIKINDHYEKFKNEKYSTKESCVINELRIFSKGTSDSLLEIIDSGTSFSTFHKIKHKDFEYKKIFITKKTNPTLFDAASLLNINETSPVLLSPDNSFSIIQLIKRQSAKQQKFLTVYSRIESLLLKKQQDLNKKNSIDGLLKKYKVTRHKESLR